MHMHHCTDQIAADSNREHLLPQQIYPEDITRICTCIGCFLADAVQRLDLRQHFPACNHRTTSAYHKPLSASDFMECCAPAGRLHTSS